MLQDVISGNLARQRRARELNRRAGNDMFPVLSREEMQAWLMPRLNGARRVVEIADLSALVLPPLDAELEASVLRDNPDTVTLLGEELKVEYRGSGYVPRVVVRVDDPAVDRRWLDLPEELKLPGGAPLEVEFCGRYGYTVACSQSGMELREKLRSHLNAKQWDAWTDRPAIPLPDPADPAAVVPEITTAEYGKCVIDGSPLVAYGTVKVDYYGRFESVWSKSREEVEATRAKAVTKLEELRATERAKAKEAEVRAEAERLHKQLRDLAWSDMVEELPEAIRDRLHQSRYGSLPYDLGALALYVEQTPAFIAQVEREFALVAERRAQAEREREAAEAVERAELAPILASDERISLEEARKIRVFAEVCLRFASGNRDVAIRKIASEFRAEYGRARRQEGLRNAFPGLDRTEEGQEVLGFYRAEDLDLFLGGALAWLKSRAEAPSAKKPAAAPPPAAAPATRQVPGGLDLSGLGSKFAVRKK